MGDQTKHPETKRPKDKTSIGTQRPREKSSLEEKKSLWKTIPGANLPETKRSRRHTVRVMGIETSKHSNCILHICCIALWLSMYVWPALVLMLTKFHCPKTKICYIADNFCDGKFLKLQYCCHWNLPHPVVFFRLSVCVLFRFWPDVIALSLKLFVWQAF